MGVARRVIRPFIASTTAVALAALGAAIVGCGDTARVPVTSVPVASVSVAPPSGTVTVGATTQLTAAVRDGAGNVLADRGITWSSADPAIATVSATGLVTGARVGQTTVAATSEGKTGASTLVVTSPPSPDVAVLLAAGDIANCGRNGDEQTAALLDTLPGTVITLGDNAYQDGTLSEYQSCYEPTWGRHKARTRPAPGNHEYNTPNAAGYYAYFGAAAGDPAKGYYSYDAGEWHVIVVNDNIAYSVGSPQERWLREDLASHPRECTLAYFHKPRFSSSARSSSYGAAAVWQALYDGGADVILSSHDHLYERFAPQRPDGTADPQRGIRQFTVGTGGSGLYELGTPLANSEVRNNTTYGVLKLTLHRGGYDWKFVPVSGQTFTDSGSDTCH